jgi:predicted dehydrogenase
MANNQSPRITRRYFFGQSAMAAAGLTLAGSLHAAPKVRRISPNEKMNVAVIGAGGKGSSDTDSVASENIVALCDIDDNTLSARGQKYPGAKKYNDYRKMLDEMNKEIDAVIVATPDHHHAPASIRAMRMGKHVYCQKPLTHSVYEARLMRETAKKYKVATQMGNQGSAESGLRRAIEVIQAGTIGNVRQVHVWSNRPIWPQGMGRPTGTSPVPSNIHWDLFLGPAPERPYHPDYQPFKWRGWVDYGTGALGDMACHTANMPFRALKLGYPTSIEAETSGFNGESYPKSSTIRFEFPAREGLAPVSFFWYDGGRKPNDDVAGEVLSRIETQKDKEGKPMARKLPGSGCLLIGDKGHLFSPDDYGAKFFLLPEKSFVDFKGPDQTIPRSPGHYKEWIDACKGGNPAFSNFDIAAYLTEIILLGCVAIRAGKRVEWDGPRMKSKNAPEVAQFVKRKYRKGWEV